MNFKTFFKSMIFFSVCPLIFADTSCYSTIASDPEIPATPSTVIVGDCEGHRYVHKSANEVDKFSGRELFHELLMEKAYHATAAWSQDDHDNDYAQMLLGRIRKHGSTILSILIDAIESYDVKKSSWCSETGFLVAADIAVTLDRDDFRIRSTPAGKIFVESLQRKVDEMKKAGFEKPTDPHNGRFDLYRLYLEELKGVNETDRAISDTLWVEKKILMTESELSDFSEFLTSRHPEYPSWSKTKFIKDTTRVEDGNPLQVFVLTDPRRFYQEYAAFKSRNRSTTKRDNVTK